MMETQEVIDKRQWETYAKENLERQALPTNTEIELWHDGSAEFYYSKIRRIASVQHERSGMTAETWEALTEKDMPPTFTVLLHKGTLESHIHLCKFRETDFGARLVQKITLMSVLLLYIPLLSSLAGLLPTNIDLLQWYWVAPISLVAGIFTMVGWYNKVAVCGRLVLECAMPEHEKGNHHVCYVCHSKAGNVLRQLNAWDRHAAWMDALVDGLVDNLNQQVVDMKNYIFKLEYEASERDKETVHQTVRSYNRRMKMGDGPVTSKSQFPLIAALMVLTVIGTAALMYAIMGG